MTDRPILRLCTALLLLPPLAALQAIGAAATSGLALPEERGARFAHAAPGDYRAYFIGQLDALRAKYFRTDDAFLRGSTEHIHIAALVAACELRAWQWTQDERYARSAVARLRLIAGKREAIREVGFFTPFPLAFAWRAAAGGQLADAALNEAMEQFVAQRLKPRDFNSLNNQTMLRACGLELAAQVWPALPQARQWHAYALQISSLLAQIEDIPENAPNYNSLDLVGTWLLADLLKQPDLTTKPGIAAMYRRYRDQVSPLGFIAPYGDSGTATRPVDPDWPMNSPWAHYVAAFERAARAYRDPTLRWAATRLAQAGARHMPLDAGYTDIESLFYFSFAADWAETRLVPRTPVLGSQVLMRRDEHSTNTCDKLILAPSRQPGAPFVMADLYSRGAHGHVNQHGAITYFECHDTPLLTALGYNNREPAQANLVLLAPAEAPFPHSPGGFVPEVWHEASLPTERLPLPDESQPFLRRIDKLNFRITAGRQGVVFSAAHLRLAGSDQPVLTLDDLSDAQGWGGQPTAAAEGLVWHVAPGVQFLEKAGFGKTFDCRMYPRLMVRWKLSNNDEQARPIILRVHSGDKSLDYHVQAAQLEPTLVSAQVEERDGVQRGTLRYTGWFTADTTLCRQLALLPTGALIVRDTLVPGPLARGMVAGPLWHMAATNVPASGPNWFNSAGGKVELFTWFAPMPAQTAGLQTAAVWSKDHQQTVFARQTLQPGQPAVFVSVLIPHDRGTDAAALAQQVSIRMTRDGCLEIKPDRQSLSVAFPKEKALP